MTAPLWPASGREAPEEEERQALVALSALVEPGRWDVADAVAQHGAVEVVRALSRGQRVGRVPAAVTAGAAARAGLVRPHAALEALRALGGRLVCPGDAEWPSEALRWGREQLEHAPPLALQVRGPGDLAGAQELAVAVVGARAASAYGLHVGEALGHDLAERGAAVVSGLALGVDGAAHRGALTAARRGGAGPAVAVLGCGVDQAYPPSHARLLEEVVDTGLVVSEVVCGTRPTRARFLVRNRLIAALSRGTVVVEATVRSGTRSTAGRADDLSRVLMAVPGPVTAPGSEFPHLLLRQGAVAVTCAEHVLEAVARPGQQLVLEPEPPGRVRDDLDRDARAVLDAVPRRGPGRGVAVLARDAGVDPRVVERVLPPLALVGLVERAPAGWRLTALGARS